MVYLSSMYNEPSGKILKFQTKKIKRKLMKNIEISEKKGSVQN